MPDPIKTVCIVNIGPANGYIGAFDTIELAKQFLLEHGAGEIEEPIDYRYPNGAKCKHWVALPPFISWMHSQGLSLYSTCMAAPHSQEDLDAIDDLMDATNSEWTIGFDLVPMNTISRSYDDD